MAEAVAVPTPAERQAFLYLALVTALGTAVRAWEGRVAPAGADGARALAAQLAAVDSALARRAGGAARGGQAPASTPRTARAAPAPRRPSASAGEAPGPVDVDVADSAALERLPGIGPSLAARIVADRAARGSFGSADGLQRVRGIGPALARRLAGHVTFSGVPRPDEGAQVSPTRRRSP